MPELPEVETMCRCIAAAAGCRIRDVQRPQSRLQSILISPRIDAFRRRVVGRTIEAIRRVGKRIVLDLDAHNGCGNSIVIEPRMTGLVMLADPPDREHLRLVFRLSGGRAGQILFWDQRGLGVARLLSAADFVEHCGSHLGPDALTITAETLQERLCDSRRAIKVALLDQYALAGVGNLYASEILHLAHIHPAVSCRRLHWADWLKIHAAMAEILRAAIRHQGSTLGDGTYRIARNRPGDYQIFHRVYRRDGEPCLQCKADLIVRIVQTQRSTFFCPTCQPPCSCRRRQ